MADHKDDFKEIEELLKKQAAHKLPDGLLSDFTEEVLTRIQNPAASPAVSGAWVFAAAVVLLCVLSASVWWAVRPAAREHTQRTAVVIPAPVPVRPVTPQVPVIAATAKNTAPAQARTKTAAAQKTAVKARKDLTLDEEVRLLEEVTGDSSFLEGVVDDEELIRQELVGLPTAQVGR